MSWRILLSFLVFLGVSPAALAAPEDDEMGPFPGSGGAVYQPPTSYISNQNPSLDATERKALELSRQYANQQIEPMLVANGKVVYMHGATMPTIIAAPLQICDVELQPGEEVNEIMLGDSARWLIEVATSGGSSSGPVTHLLIKPLNAGLETNAVITTDRRVYHLKLVSRKSGHTPYVGFTYLQDIQRLQAEQQRREEKKQVWNSGDFDGQAVDLSKLNFNYDISGEASWRPERVYDDGRQMFIRLPSRSRNGEIPVLLVQSGQKDVLVNYRVNGSTMVVDGIFERIALILGVGREQQKVEIRRY